MQICKYGVILERITVDTIELLREWRNSPKINQYMEYREHITQEMQTAWFENLDSKCGYYFVIVFEDRKIGMINIKNIDWTRHCGEAGIYIYDDTYINTDVSFRAMCTMLDFCFDDLDLLTIDAHILQTNKRAQRYNACFGYTVMPNQEHILNQWHVLKREDYKERFSNIKQLFSA